jgi:hypothetical protein
MASAVYPTNVRSFGADVVDFTTTILAEHVNYLRAEVNSVETVLGNLPLTSSGWVGSFDRTTTTWNTVRDRITNIEYGLNTAYDAKVPTGGTQYQVLQKNSSSNYDFSWVTFNGLPTQSGGTTGQFLTSNGSSASWASINQYTAPTLGTTSIGSGATVTNVVGLTINSTTIPTSKTLVSTDSVYAVPSQSGATGKYLTSDGTTSSWGTVSASGGANEFVLMMMGA